MIKSTDGVTGGRTCRPVAVARRGCTRFCLTEKAMSIGREQSCRWGRGRGRSFDNPYIACHAYATLIFKERPTGLQNISTFTMCI